MGPTVAVIEVAALTSGRDAPSARFRVRQHVPHLARAGIRVREFAPVIDKYRPLPLPPRWRRAPLSTPLQAGWALLKLATRLPGVVAGRRADVTWLQRDLLPGFYTLERLVGRPYVFDVDDAVWLTRPGSARSVARIAEGAAVVVTGNRFLASWFEAVAGDVRVVHTAVDTRRFTPRPRQSAGDDRFVVGWTGTSSNLVYLEAIESPLAEFLSATDSELLVVADAPPRFSTIDPERVRFVRWHPDTEVAAVQDMDVGLMPLPDTDWARGKCSFKMLQYMSCGVPPVVSPVGMNAEVLDMGDVGLGVALDDHRAWVDRLSALSTDRDGTRRLGANGRALVVERFDSRVIAAQIAGILEGVASGG